MTSSAPMATPMKRKRYTGRSTKVMEEWEERKRRVRCRAIHSSSPPMSPSLMPPQRRGSRSSPLAARTARRLSSIPLLPAEGGLPEGEALPLVVGLSLGAAPCLTRSGCGGGNSGSAKSIILWCCPPRDGLRTAGQRRLLLPRPRELPAKIRLRLPDQPSREKRSPYLPPPRCPRSLRRAGRRCSRGRTLLSLR